MAAPLAIANTYTDLTYSVPGMDYILSLATDGSTQMIGGGTTNKLYATDGTTFTPLTANIPALTSVRAIGRGPSYWFFGGSAGAPHHTSLYQFDGSIWTDKSAAMVDMDEFGCIESNGSNTWLGSAHLYSFDGINFTDLTGPWGGKIMALAWTGSAWLIGGGNSGGAYLYSYDGSYHDLSANVAAMSSVNSIGVNGSDWLIGGAGTATLISYDGSVWTDLSSQVPGAVTFNTIDSNANAWLLGGVGASTLYSYDGTSFTDLTTQIPGITIVHAITTAGDSFLVGGEGSSILYKVYIEGKAQPAAELPYTGR